MIKNELALYENIQKSISQPRKETVFPLTPTHRKELRQLRDKNIGNLREQLSNIKSLKKDEFIQKYQDTIKLDFKNKKLICEKLNKEWEKFKNKINEWTQQRQLLEDKIDLKHLSLNNDYGDIPSLRKIEYKRLYTIDENQVSTKINSDLFDKKYGKAFILVDDEIDKIVTMYEEAINFGDLEIVKKLYFMMKNSESLFIKINNLKI